MKIHVLVDNCAGKACASEWGLSFYIEAEINILFDFGASDLFLKNGEKNKVDFAKLDYLVLSHGHWDHGNGLRFLRDKKLVCHPAAFTRRISGERKTGLPLTKEECLKRFELILAADPCDLTEKFTFLGQIPRNNKFEAQDTEFSQEDGSKDYLEDDSALVYKGEEGLIIVSGCAHSGICNIVDYAVKVTGINKIKAVIGGFHLKKGDSITAKTIDHLKALRVEQVIPTHCTAFPALVEFNKHFGSSQIYAGQVIEL
ncbi:MAG: MBL fold metallo-hydrolase [Peptococcaceae bacterium]